MGNVSQSAPQCTSTYLLAENRLVRETLARVLRKRAGISVVGVQPPTDAAVEDAFASGCEVILTDSLIIFRHDHNLKFESTNVPRVNIVLFGMDEDPATFWRAACFGVNAYLLKDASASEIFGAVRAVTQGEAVCPPRLCMTLIKRIAERSQTERLVTVGAAARSPLTHRQKQLVDLVARGMTNKEIAANLNLSEFTVKNHIHRIMKQVDAGSRHHVVEMIRAQHQP